jgi:hypothetical protein
VVEVTTSGGFAGRGKGNVTVYSNGALACEPPMAACGPALAPQSAASLRALVLGLEPGAWTSPKAAPCSDCYVTTLTVRRRVGNAQDIARSYTWNDAQAADVPPSVKRLHAAVLAFSAQRR